MTNYEKTIRIAENILLRPNDHKLLLGEAKFNLVKENLEKVLEEQYKNDEIYQYYHELPKVKHGFCSFERWKRGLLF